MSKRRTVKSRFLSLLAKAIIAIAALSLLPVAWEMGRRQGRREVQSEMEVKR